MISYLSKKKAYIRKTEPPGSLRIFICKNRFHEDTTQRKIYNERRRRRRQWWRQKEEEEMKEKQTEERRKKEDRQTEGEGEGEECEWE